jgi:hypothetical protein
MCSQRVRPYWMKLLQSMSAAPGRPKPLGSPLRGARAKQALGPFHGLALHQVAYEQIQDNRKQDAAGDGAGQAVERIFHEGDERFKVAAMLARHFLRAAPHQAASAPASTAAMALASWMSFA